MLINCQGICPVVIFAHARRVGIIDLEYSNTPPSSGLQAERESKMLCFNVGKCLGKCVGNHVVGRAINRINCPIIHNESNKMIPYVYVFGTGVIRPIAGECNSSLRV